MSSSAEPPSAQVLACDERFIEIPGVAADLMVQAHIAPRDELKFFWNILHLQCRPKSGLAKIGQVTILLGYGYAIPPRNLTRGLLTGPDRLQAHCR